MTDRARIWIAMAITALFIGAMSIAGALSHSHSAYTQATTAAPAAVQTTTFHEEND